MLPAVLTLFDYPSGAVALLGDVLAVEQLVGLVAAGLAQVGGVDLLEHGVLVALANEGLGVLIVERLGPQALDVGEGTDIGMDIFDRGLCLPSDNKMTESEQAKIIDIVRACFD